jgi:hypothetical protein
VIDIVALAAQVTGFVVWPLIEGGQQPALWFIPLALFLTSFGWWENFVSKKSALGIFCLPLKMHFDCVHCRFHALHGRNKGQGKEVALLHLHFHITVENSGYPYCDDSGVAL